MLPLRCLRRRDVVLLSFDIRAHIFRRHELHRMSLRCQQASQMVRAATRLHRDNATRQLGGERENRLATHPPAQDHGPIPVDAYQATDVLAQVDAQYDYCHGSLLLSSTTSILPMLRKGRAIP